jgi:hypothetical protein
MYTQTEKISALFVFSCLLALTSLHNAHAAAAGYVPTASVTPGATSTVVKSAITKIGFAPYDAMAKVWPAVAAGAAIGVSAVGATASSVYAGSAAAVSKMYIPLKTGSQMAIDLVANIPKAKLAASAVAVLKNPYLGIALVAGTALYDWYTNSGLIRESDGTLLTVQPATMAAVLVNGFAVAGSGGVISSTFSDSMAGACVLNGSTLGTGTGPWGSPGVCVNGNGVVESSRYQCPSGYNISGTTCNRISASSDPVPVSDADALIKLQSTIPANPAGVLKQVVEAGETPEVDAPIVTAPPSTTVDSQTTTHPDGSTTTVDDKINAICTGDSCTLTQQSVTTDKNAAGTVTGTSTTSKPPLVDSQAGQIPATTSPLDLSPVVTAINTAATQAHADAQDVKAEVQAVPDHILNDVPPIMPTTPEMPPDETPQFVDMMSSTDNPFSYDASDFMPTLPNASCSYEIHRTLPNGKPFDVAPCADLAPLRAVLGWVFSILTLWSCFLIIFKVSSV